MTKIRAMLQNIIIRSTNVIRIVRCSNAARRFSVDRRGFGMNEILGIAAGLIIAALIVVPGLKTFTNNIMDKLSQWWLSVQNIFFSTSIQ
ncbi:MAG: hypothetical protein HPY74_07405 [Firmicutes bacterium]|nr:hypothetical protein [Bacillota bacterium]